MTRTEQRKNKRRKNKFFFSPYLTEEQAYAKWEKGETIPDVERCQKLARMYGTTIDALISENGKVGHTPIAPAPKGKHIFGTAKINDRGQIVIPKKARDLFDIKKDDELVILGDETEGIALVKVELFEQRINFAQANAKIEI